MRGKERSAPEAGFVLIAVLSVTALLALMLGASSLLARSAVDTSVVESAFAREQAMIQAGVEIAGHQLFGLGLLPAAIDGQEIRLDDGTLRIFATAEAGRVDLNGADGTLLAAAYRASGLGSMDPDIFAERVIAWRDASAPPSTGEGAGRGAAFRTTGDLRWLDGIGQDEIGALEPFITVFNPGGRIDPLAAPRALLLALPGLLAESVDRIPELSGMDRTEALLAMRSIFRGLEVHLVLGEPTRAVAVRIEARLPGKRAPRAVRAVLLAPVTSTKAYHIADWVEERVN